MRVDKRVLELLLLKNRDGWSGFSWLVIKINGCLLQTWQQTSRCLETLEFLESLSNDWLIKEGRAVYSQPLFVEFLFVTVYVCLRVYVSRK
jgi:hypothetical protein